MSILDAHQASLLRRARLFYVGHKEAVGALIIPGADPIFIKSGIDGGPWGGTHRGGIPRLPECMAGLIERECRAGGARGQARIYLPRKVTIKCGKSIFII